MKEGGNERGTEKKNGVGAPTHDYAEPKHGIVVVRSGTFDIGKCGSESAFLQGPCHGSEHSKHTNESIVSRRQ